MHVLIVDDEYDIRVLVGAFLKRAGIASTGCASIAEAQRVLDSQQFDFYLLDINLPDGLGTDLAVIIHSAHNKANIVLMSAYDDAMDGIDTQALPILDFIKKPFTPKQLITVLQNNL